MANTNAFSNWLELYTVAKKIEVKKILKKEKSKENKLIFLLEKKKRRSEVTCMFRKEIFADAIEPFDGLMFSWKVSKEKLFCGEVEGFLGWEKDGATAGCLKVGFLIGKCLCFAQSI